MNPLRIVLATSELFPFSKTGGLADVTSALGRYLSLNAHDVRIFTPLHAIMDTGKFPLTPVDFLQQIPLQLGSHHYLYSVYTTTLPGSGLWVYFIHCPQLYDRSGVYSNDPDEHRRFLLLCHAVFQCCQRMGWAPDVLHCNDWQTGPAPLLQRTVYSWDRLFQATRSVLTIHNIGYQGVFSSSVWPDVVPARYRDLLHQADLSAGMINFLKTGLLYADVLTTVSPTYAREIQTADFGAGLEEILWRRRNDLYGILNGVDYDEWSPQNDPHIHFQYGRRAPVTGKNKNKKFLLDQFRLPYQERTPLVGIVSRLVAQKGFDLLFEPLPRMLQERDFQLAVLGSGEHRYQDFFRSLQTHFPEKVCFYRGYSDQLAHWVEAGSDIFLMPSRYEPCGLNQMYSLKYGTIPVVRKTGGLADTVEHYDPKSGTGTGFVFEHFTPEGLAWALSQALDTYGRRKHWLKLMRNAMACDFSWSLQVGHYIRLYARLLGLPSEQEIRV